MELSTVPKNGMVQMELSKKYFKSMQPAYSLTMGNLPVGKPTFSKVVWKLEDL